MGRKKIIFDKKEFARDFPTTGNAIPAARYGVKKSTIRTWAAKMGLKKKEYFWTKGDIQFLKRNYGSQQMTIDDIAMVLRRTRDAVINKYREVMKLR